MKSAVGNAVDTFVNIDELLLRVHRPDNASSFEWQVPRAVGSEWWWRRIMDVSYPTRSGARGGIEEKRIDVKVATYVFCGG